MRVLVTSRAERQGFRRHFEALAPRERIPAIVDNFIRIAEDGLDEIDAPCGAFVPDAILRESMAFAGWALGARRECPVVVVDPFPVPPEMWPAASGKATDSPGGGS